jgi:hypothetical protein
MNLATVLQGTEFIQFRTQAPQQILMKIHKIAAFSGIFHPDAHAFVRQFYGMIAQFIDNKPK